MLLAFRLARAYDRQHEDEQEQLITRIVTPVAKYWLCKRLPMMMAECMEVLGGNGFVEEAGPIARLYREAPLNGIWEGSGNVICLDVLRAMRKPKARHALFRELGPGADGRVSRYLDVIGDSRARRRRARGRAARHRDARAILSGVAARAHAPGSGRRRVLRRPAGRTAARRSGRCRPRRVRDDHRARPGCLGRRPQDSPSSRSRRQFARPERVGHGDSPSSGRAGVCAPQARRPPTERASASAVPPTAGAAARVSSRMTLRDLLGDSTTPTSSPSPTTAAR